MCIFALGNSSAQQKFFIMIYKVQILGLSEVHLFSPSEFFHFLLGLSVAGRDPILHFNSTRSNDPSNDFNQAFDYSVIIDFK